MAWNLWKRSCWFACVLVTASWGLAAQSRSFSFTTICRQNKTSESSGQCEGGAIPGELEGKLLERLPTSSAIKCSAGCASLDECKVFGFRKNTPTGGSCLLLTEYFNCAVLTSGGQQCYSYKAKVGMPRQFSDVVCCT